MHFNEKLFKIALVKADKNCVSLSKDLKIAHSTLMRKIKSGCFLIEEVLKIKQILKLTNEEVMTIFFAEQCASMHNSAI